jgi:hypothetical protein
MLTDADGCSWVAWFFMLSAFTLTCYPCARAHAYTPPRAAGKTHVSCAQEEKRGENQEEKKGKKTEEREESRWGEARVRVGRLMAPLYPLYLFSLAAALAQVLMYTDVC